MDQKQPAPCGRAAVDPGLDEPNSAPPKCDPFTR
jgi:hypothetical protein